MTAHGLYVTAAYLISTLVIAALVGWVVLDHRGRKRELVDLEASGLRRRSDKSGQQDGS